MRNLLGGAEAAERWPIRSDFGGLVLLGAFLVVGAVIGTPLILLWILAMVLGRLLRNLSLRIRTKPVRDGEVVEMEGVAGFGVSDSGSVVEEATDKD